MEDKLLIWRFKRGSADAFCRIYEKYDLDEEYDRVLTEEFRNKGRFADYYIERIDQSLDLCGRLEAGGFEDNAP